MTTFLMILGIYLASVLFMRLRGRTFESWPRQMSDFSSFMVPFNLPAYLFSKIPCKPIIDKSHFPEIQVIEDNWEIVREEALKLYDSGYITTHDDLPASSFYKDNRWKSFYLKAYNNQIPSAYIYAPKTMELINQVPYMNLALFAVLMPGKTINQHHDPFSFTVRYSLGLSTPNSDDCGIVVDTQDYKWKDGDSIIFDENYMHNAYNHTDTPRLILMTDLDRPMSFKPAQKMYYYFGYWFNRAFGIDNVDSNHKGIGNKLGAWVVGYKAFMKGLKRKNRTLYIIGKNIFFFSLLAWFIESMVN